MCVVLQFVTLCLHNIIRRVCDKTHYLKTVTMIILAPFTRTLVPTSAQRTFYFEKPSTLPRINAVFIIIIIFIFILYLLCQLAASRTQKAHCKHMKTHEKNRERHVRHTIRREIKIQSVNAIHTFKILPKCNQNSFFIFILFACIIL